MGRWVLAPKGGTRCGAGGREDHPCVIAAGEPVYLVELPTTGRTLPRCRVHAPRALEAGELEALQEQAHEQAEREALAESDRPLSPSQYIAQSRGRLRRPGSLKPASELADVFDPKLAAANDR